MGSSLKARPAATLPRGAFWADLGGFAAGLICVCGFSWLLRLTASMGWRQVRAIPTVHGGGFGFPKPKAFPFGIQCHILYGFYRSAEKRNHRRREELLVTQPLGLARRRTHVTGGKVEERRYPSLESVQFALPTILTSCYKCPRPSGHRSHSHTATANSAVSSSQSQSPERRGPAAPAKKTGVTKRQSQGPSFIF